MSQIQYPRLLYVLPAFLIIVSSFIILTRLVPSQRDNSRALTPTPTTLMSNWKAYRDEKQGFEIKYPSNWLFASPKVLEGYFFQITRQESREDLIQLIVYHNPPHTINGFSYEDTVYIDGLPAIAYFFIPSPTDLSDDIARSKPQPHVYIRLKKDGKDYEFRLFNTQAVSGDFRRILSTFKFTN